MGGYRSDAFVDLIVHRHRSQSPSDPPQGPEPQAGAEPQRSEPQRSEPQGSEPQRSESQAGSGAGAQNTRPASGAGSGAGSGSGSGSDTTLEASAAAGCRCARPVKTIVNITIALTEFLKLFRAAQNNSGDVDGEYSGGVGEIEGLGHVPAWVARAMVADFLNQTGCSPALNVPMVASLRMPTGGVFEGPAAGRGGAFGRQGDGQVGLVVMPVSRS